MKRIDTHRPSAIIPADYVFVALGYTGPNFGDIEAACMQRRLLNEHMAKTGGKFSGHEHVGTCHVCGAHALYTARFYHAKTNSYITTGLDCAAKLDMGDAIAFRNFRKQIAAGIEAATGKAKAQRILGDAGLSAAWGIYTADTATLPRGRDDGLLYEESTIIDIVGKLVAWGSMSEAQSKFLAGLLGRIEQRAAKAAEQAARDANRADVPTAEGRVEVVGKVLSTKVVDTDFGSTIKMLVEHETGFKLWGTVPAALPIGEGTLKGSTVAFTARIERSKDDPKFGFFSRPSKARIVTAAPAA